MADDSPQARSAISRLLQSLPGIDVIALASDGKEAVLLAASSNPDLILLDLQMPGMNGLEVLRALRDRNLLARIIMVTLHDSPEIRAECRQGGTDGFVAKSDLAHDLPKEIARIFNNNSGDHNSRG